VDKHPRQAPQTQNQGFHDSECPVSGRPATGSTSRWLRGNRVMSNPRLRIDLARITHNARKTVDMARSRGVEVTGVTKGVAGNAEVARAMLAGGIQTLADSRLDNIARLRSAGIEAPVMLLRSPGPSDVSRTVALADVSLNAGMAIMEALSSEASARHKVHGVILMVDLHTGREGLPPDPLPCGGGSYRGVSWTAIPEQDKDTRPGEVLRPILHRAGHRPWNRHDSGMRENGQRSG